MTMQQYKGSLRMAGTSSTLDMAFPAIGRQEYWFCTGSKYNIVPQHGLSRQSEAVMLSCSMSFDRLLTALYDVPKRRLLKRTMVQVTKMATGDTWKDRERVLRDLGRKRMPRAFDVVAVKEGNQLARVRHKIH